MPTNAMEARHSDGMGLRYNIHNALVCTDTRGRSPVYIDLALDSHSRRWVDYISSHGAFQVQDCIKLVVDKCCKLNVKVINQRPGIRIGRS